MTSFAERYPTLDLLTRRAAALRACGLERELKRPLSDGGLVFDGPHWTGRTGATLTRSFLRGRMTVREELAARERQAMGRVVA